MPNPVSDPLISPTRTHTIQKSDDHDYGLVVHALWEQDRFQHVIGICNQGLRLDILKSLEGHHRDAWPPSPPWQQIDQQLVADIPALLALGMAGSSHYSSSLALCHLPRLRLEAQFACLLHTSGSKPYSPVAQDPSQEPFVGSSYQLLHPVTIVHASGLVTDIVPFAPGKKLVSALNQAPRVRVVLTVDAKHARINVLGSGSGSHLPHHTAAPTTSCTTFQILPANRQTKPVQWSYSIHLDD